MEMWSAQEGWVPSRASAQTDAEESNYYLQSPLSSLTLALQWDFYLHSLDPVDAVALQNALTETLALVQAEALDLAQCAALAATISCLAFRKQIELAIVDLFTGKLWNQTSDAYAYLLQEYRVSRNGAVLQLANSLATVPPGFDIFDKLLVQPELPVLRDSLELLNSDAGSQFHLPTRLRTFIAYLRSMLRASQLQVRWYSVLRTHTAEQRAAFSFLLMHEYPNDEWRLLSEPIEKAMVVLASAEEKMQRLSYVLRNNSNLSAGVYRDAERAMQEFPTRQLQNCFPRDLEPLLEFSVVPSVKAWLAGFLQSTSDIARTFPIDVDLFLEGVELGLPSDAFEYCKRQLISVAFPEILLYSELAESGSVLPQLWQDAHSCNFTDFLLSLPHSPYRLTAVFTRDSSAPDHCEALSEGNLISRLTAFIESQTENLLVFAADLPMDLDTSLCAIEKLHSRLAKAGKSLCLLVRVSAGNRAVCRWSCLWQLTSIELLSAPFAPSQQSLHSWLQADAKTLLSHLSSGPESLKVTSRIYEKVNVSPTIREKHAANFAESDELMCALAEKLPDSFSLRDWKTFVLAAAEEASLKEAVANLLAAEATALLAPFVAEVENFSALSSFVNAPRGSLARTVWLETFRTLPGCDSAGDVPNFETTYPFALRDFREVISKTPASLSEFEDIFEKKSITVAHCRDHPDWLSGKRIADYVADIARMDLQTSPHWREGSYFYKSLCGQAQSFSKAAQKFCKFRAQVMALCDPNTHRKSEQRQVLADVTDAIFTPSGEERVSRNDLLQRLRDFAGSLRLYAVRDRSLTTFDCSTQTFTWTTLDESLGVKYAMIVQLTPAELFCCGGGYPGLLSTYHSKSTWKVEASTGAVQHLPDMGRERCDHGLVLFDQFVYAIGGGGNIWLRSCEKFSLQSGQWADVPTQMRVGRMSFTPCVWLRRIYLCGGFDPSIEVLSPDSGDAISLVETARMAVSSGIAFVRSNSLHVISNTHYFLLDLLSGTVERCTPHRETTVETMSQPVMYNGLIFMIDNSRKVTWIAENSGDFVGEKSI